MRADDPVPLYEVEGLGVVFDLDFYLFRLR